jgi:hypothetical protein
MITSAQRSAPRPSRCPFTWSISLCNCEKPTEQPRQAKGHTSGAAPALLAAAFAGRRAAAGEDAGCRSPGAWCGVLAGVVSLHVLLVLSAVAPPSGPD